MGRGSRYSIYPDGKSLSVRGSHLGCAGLEWRDGRADDWGLVAHNWCRGGTRGWVAGRAVASAGDIWAIAPWGKVWLEAGAEAGVHALGLSAATLTNCREKFPAPLDADAFVMDG